MFVDNSELMQYADEHTKSSCLSCRCRYSAAALLHAPSVGPGPTVLRSPQFVDSEQIVCAATEISTESH